ncbi:MAG: hypothetical protein JXA10_05370 [Anaerolineae bacterium]|nr:hypothetical protein [Anaerolineae bacterium]
MTQVEADVWGWIRNFRYAAQRDNDRQRQRLVDLHDEAIRLRRRSADEALPVFQEGRELARMLNEKCWEVWLWHWECEVYVFYYGDMAMARDETTKLLVEIRKPMYESCPAIGRCYRIYVDTHVFIDPVGYEQEVREMIAYMQQRVPLDYDTQCLLIARLVNLDFALGDFDKAKERALEYLAISRSAFRLANAHADMCFMEYVHGNLESALAHALESEKNARRTLHNRTSLPQAIAWQALLAYKLGYTHLEPDLLFQRAITEGGTTRDNTSNLFIEGVSRYLELHDKPDQAVEYRQRELSWLLGRSQFYAETEARLELCRLLGRMGKLTPDDTAAAREVASHLLNPALYLARLDRVEQGDYTADWAE